MTRAYLPGRFDVDRASRFAILVATTGAVAWEAVFGGWSGDDRRHYAEPIALSAAFLITTLDPVAGRALVMIAACVLPSLLNALTGLFDFSLSGVWIAALLGVIVAETGLRGWSLPRAWRPPIVLWGLCVAIAWPIIVAREADFSLAQLYNTHMGVTSRGVAPRFESVWIAHVASVHLIGMLWIDTLFAVFGTEPVERFERQIVWPFAAGALASIAVGLYQMTVDPLFLNATIYGVMGRAAGLMQDGNVFGTLSAMWAAGFMALALHARGAKRLIAVVASCLALIAVWGSGSRTALLAAGCAVVGVGYGIWKTLPTTRARLRASLAAIGAAAAIASIVALSSATAGPMDRIRLALARSRGNQQSLVAYLWERGGHGMAATRMIRENPAFGVGVGTFHTLVLDYSRALGPSFAVGPDNAQNWFRHQLAELGIVGSVGWIALATLVTAAVLRPGRGADARRAVIVAGALVGLGLASLLGMPTQHVVVLLMFWTFVFWYHRLRGVTWQSGEAGAPKRGYWVVVATIALTFTAGTLHAARTDLRVSNRALRFGWPYAYGFHDMKDPAAGLLRSTGKKAVAVFRTRGRYLKLTLWAEHPDLAARPVGVRIWRGSDRIANLTLSSPSHVTWYVRTPAQSEWMMLETEVSRTFSVKSRGDEQPAEIGLVLADWEFVETPPSNSAVVD